MQLGGQELQEAMSIVQGSPGSSLKALLPALLSFQPNYQSLVSRQGGVLLGWSSQVPPPSPPGQMASSLFSISSSKQNHCVLKLVQDKNSQLCLRMPRVPRTAKGSQGSPGRPSTAQAWAPGQKGLAPVSRGAEISNMWVSCSSL